MSTGAMVVAVIGVLGSLILVWRGVDRIPNAWRWRYALIWGVIILALVLLIQITGLEVR